jgi:hypothetical protein
MKRKATDGYQRSSSNQRTRHAAAVKRPRQRQKESAAARGQIASPEPERATVGTLSRTKSLLLAALPVGELKQRISDQSGVNLWLAIPLKKQAGHLLYFNASALA